MLADDFIPQKWLNSIFSELENFEVVQNPYDEWFLWNTATLRKRPGLLSSDDRETEWTILGKVISWWVAWIWDDIGNVYRFEKILDVYTMTKIYSNPWTVSIYSTNSYGNKVKQVAKIVPYLSGKWASWTADKVNSTNDDGNGNVVLWVNEAWTFDNTMTWQYIYFTDAASTAARYQIRQIVQYIDDKTVYLSEQYYWETGTWAAAEPGETYETMDNVVVFNNLRNSAWLCLTISATNSAETSFRNLWGIDVTVFDWRRWVINNYWTSVWGSVATWEYEILDPKTIMGSSTDARGQKMDSLMLFKNYLLINQENSMVVVRQLGNNSTWVPIYNMNTILSGVSAFGYDAICSKDWGMYFLWKDRIFNSWDINAISTNIIEWATKNQGIIISKFLSEIDDTDYIRVYSYGRWVIIHRANATATTMYMYDDIYEGWLPQIYDGLNITDKFESFYGDLLICVNNSICLRSWTSDLWANISVKCVVTGSKQIINSVFSLKKIKLMLGYFYNVVSFKITVDLGKKVFIGTVQKNANWVEYLIRQNLAVAWGWIGSVPIGYNQLWWTNNLQDKIAKVWLIGIPMMKQCTYYKITLENIDNYDLNITGITALVEQGNPFITPLQNVF